MGGDRTLNEALHQAVKLEEAKTAARPPANLPVRKVVEARRRLLRATGAEGRCAGNVEAPVISGKTPRGPTKRPTTNYNWRTVRATGKTTDATRQVPEAARTTQCATFLPDEKQQLEARILALERQNSELKEKVPELVAAQKTKKSNAVAPRNDDNQSDVQQRVSCRRV
jgi:hypothetical protein